MSKSKSIYDMNHSELVSEKERMDKSLKQIGYGIDSFWKRYREVSKMIQEIEIKQEQGSLTK